MYTENKVTLCIYECQVLLFNPSNNYEVPVILLFGCYRVRKLGKLESLTSHGFLSLQAGW